MPKLCQVILLESDDTKLCQEFLLPQPIGQLSAILHRRRNMGRCVNDGAAWRDVELSAGSAIVSTLFTQRRQVTAVVP